MVLERIRKMAQMHEPGAFHKMGARDGAYFNDGPLQNTFYFQTLGDADGAFGAATLGGSNIASGKAALSSLQQTYISNAQCLSQGCCTQQSFPAAGMKETTCHFLESSVKLVVASSMKSSAQAQTLTMVSRFLWLRIT